MKSSLFWFVQIFFSLLLPLDAAANGEATESKDGRSDYRFAQANIRPADRNKSSETCKRFESKYVEDHVLDKELKIHQGEVFSVFLKNAYFSNVPGFFSSTAEAAILLNSDVNSPFVKKGSADYGRLIYYSDSVADASAVNASYVPAMTIETAVGIDTVSLDLSVVQFDSRNSAIARSMFRTLVSLGTSALAPQAASVLSTLGNSIGTTQAGGTRTTQYRMGFSIGAPNSKVRQPLLREGDLVLFTSQEKENLLDWASLYFNHRDGVVYKNAACTELVKKLDYVVLTIRKSTTTGIDESRNQTLGDVIDSVRRRSTSNAMVGTNVAAVVQDALNYDAAKDAIKNYNQTLNAGLKATYLNQLLRTLSCGANGNPAADCAQVKLDDPRMYAAIQRVAVEAGILCFSELEEGTKALAGAPIATHVAAVAATVSTRGGAKCL